MVLRKKYVERESAKMFLDAINLASKKHDGKNHEVTVILSDWTHFVLCTKYRSQWLSAVVDNTREFGGKLGLGKQTVLHHCIVHSSINDEKHDKIENNSSFQNAIAPIIFELKNTVDEHEKHGDFAVATDTVRCYIEKLENALKTKYN